MPLILSIETSTAVCSVALHNDDDLLGVQILYIDKSHSGLLSPSIESLVRYCGFQLTDLSAVAVSEGPGSYTGLRIGISTAKGLCYALGIPIIGVNTLEAMAYGVNRFNSGKALLCPMIDARRMEVYALIVDHHMNIVEETRPVIIDSLSFLAQLEHHQMIFFGNGSAKCKDVIDSGNALFINDIHPDASYIGVLASKKFKAEEFQDVAYFEPFYLKEFRMSKPKAKQ